MSAIETFTFGRYTIRPTTSFDRCLARRWTKADPDHAHMEGDFWLDQRFGHDSYLFFDGEEAIFFLKLVLFESKIAIPPRRWIEIHIQFPPRPENEEEKKRQALQIMNALRAGLTWIERVLSQIHIECVFFRSTSQSLITFCVRHLGFIQEGEMLRKHLSLIASSS